ncbi:hypothetical protein AGMMS50268_31240 [Spirochaetia bacterium]|nr:hypothetical protein AGMMS50268_31240 [Spirochaetia bacterium]
MEDSSSRKIILTVDDQPVNLATNKMILQNYFDVRIARSGKTALSLIENVPVDLLLLDIDMPEMNGIELLKKIKIYHKARHIPVIYVTSHGSRTYLEQAIALGVNAYVVKPIVPDVLLSKISKLLNMPLPAISKDTAANNQDVSVSIREAFISDMSIYKQFKELERGCVTGNCDAVDSIMKEIKKSRQKELGLVINKAIDEISDLVTLFDYELILRKVEGILVALEGKGYPLT